MVKKRHRIGCCFLFGTVLFGTSAFAQKTTVVEKYEESQARLLDMSTNAHVKPLVAEFQIITNAELQQSVSTLNAKNGTERQYKLYGTKGRLESYLRLTKEKALVELNGSPANIRSWAIFQINKDLNADVLVGATSDILKSEQNDYFEVTVIGYPARFTNFSSITPADYEWIRLENSTQTTDSEKTKSILK